MLPARSSERPRPLLFRASDSIRGVLDFLTAVVTRGAILGFAIAFAISLKQIVFDSNFYVGEFAVPKELQESGTTGAVVGRLLFDRVLHMQHLARTVAADRGQSFPAGDSTAKIADIKLPRAEINLVALVGQLRTFLNIEDTKIEGELTA